MNHQNYPETRQKDIITQELLDETMVYDISADKAYCLNNTAARVWNLCNGKHSVEEIARILGQESKSEVSVDVVLLALNQFERDNLLANDDVANLILAGMSRREILKKAGFASAIALPLVSSIAAPIATNAQSCVPINSPCIVAVPPPCCAGTCVNATGSPGSPGICAII